MATFLYMTGFVYFVGVVVAMLLCVADPDQTMDRDEAFRAFAWPYTAGKAVYSLFQ